MQKSIRRQDRKPTFHRETFKVVIGIAAGGLLMALLAVPVVAEIAHLTSIPLGRGSATITWTGKSGISPTVNSIGGKAGGLPVSAIDEVPRIPGINEPASGSTSDSLPSSFPLANVKGTIDGAPFTLDIVLTLPQLSGSSKSSFGKVIGTFRNQKMAAIVTDEAATNTLHFTGTIGSLHISGVIRWPTHHGNKATAHASFDVTK